MYLCSVSTCLLNFYHTPHRMLGRWRYKYETQRECSEIWYVMHSGWTGSAHHLITEVWFSAGDGDCLEFEGWICYTVKDGKVLQVKDKRQSLMHIEDWMYFGLNSLMCLYIGSLRAVVMGKCGGAGKSQVFKHCPLTLSCRTWILFSLAWRGNECI